ncbi:ATP-binding protein [Demequina capsici]|uniref:ATP-binding protein n=1 Tax=Demequina capsici TaxID=3075620 RepID=A0AA96F8L7_9MICO|nr:ATP-binding protein [Demequina sp. OYTSA14]WNM24782.1 ATP-binding protein [Demequina sp. OYTSA14]
MNDTWLPRDHDAARLRAALDRAPAVLLTGQRQVGKTSLVRRQLDPQRGHYFDLEDPRDQARLADPILALEHLSGTVVIDEAQRMPQLFPMLRVLIDQDRTPGRFLLLGSASPDLVGLGAESLAGRIALVELGPLGLEEVGADHLNSLWLRGGLPEAFTAADDAAAGAWLGDYISTFLERDLAQLGSRVPATTMRRFWTMLAHRHSGTWNGAEMARSLGASEPTARRYLDSLTDALVVRQLQPWVANIGKRQVRSPKVYLRDSGTLHRLLGIPTMDDLLAHPILGASWEGLVVEHVARWGLPMYFWRTQDGAEIDLIVDFGSTRWGIEIKRTDSPKVTPSMRHALEDLGLERIIVVHAGPDRFPLAERIEAIGAAELLTSDGPPTA